jgi:hypothetical protein
VATGDAGSGTSASADGLVPALGQLRARVQWRRFWVLLRRHALVALALAIVLEALALLDVLPQWVVVAAPLALLLATLAWALRRRLSLAAVAQLFDDRLRLFDRLGTGLELERRGAGNGGGSPLERRTVAEAAALAADGANVWRPRTAAAPREWAAGAVAVVVLAALVALAVVPGSDSSAAGKGGATALGGGEGAAATNHKLNKKGLEQYLGAKSGPAQIKPGQATQGAIRPGAPRKGKAAGKRYTGEAFVTPSEGAPTAAQQGFHFSEESLQEAAPNIHASGKSQGASGEPKPGATPGGKAGGGQAPGGGGKGPGAASGGKKQSGAGQDASQGTKGSPPGAGTNPGTKTPARAPASKTAAGPKSGTSQGSPETGSPGGATAGNGAGGNKTGRSRESEGIKSKGLKLQAGYAPYKSQEGGTSQGKSGNRQGGGGKARTGMTEGTSKGNATFAFVPATGGAVATGGSQGLAQSYSATLEFLERLPW